MDAVRPAQRRLAVLRDRPYALIMILNGVMYLNMPLLSLALPLWIAERTDAPTSMNAVLLAVNMTCRSGWPAVSPTPHRGSSQRACRLGTVRRLCRVRPVIDGRRRWAASAVLLAAAAVQVLAEIAATGRTLSEEEWTDLYARHGQYRA
ncbi:hypothetical protein [Micromonospora profundi]|uniref:hypothetical protein n=1 Tax=Micromonospora profundi TaxID=1420889 RepID=UPI003655D6D1